MSSIPASRPSTFGEELANSISHGLGVLLAIVGLPVLIVNAVRIGSMAAMVGAAVFGGSAILLYMASTLYHAVSHQRAKAWLQRLDYGAISSGTCSCSPAPVAITPPCCCTRLDSRPGQALLMPVVAGFRFPVAPLALAR